MCGRYKQSTPGDELWESFDIHGEPLDLPAHFNIAPTQSIAILREPHQLSFARWGLSLANSKASGINVRVESLAAPMYREAIRTRRCLIVADGFYEWKALPGTRQKQPYLIQRRDQKPFAFAGIWQDRELQGGATEPTAAILTVPASGVPSRVHDRMPLILKPGAWQAWLDPNARFRDLLEPETASLEALPVSTRVNSTANDGPECAEPILESDSS